MTQQPPIIKVAVSGAAGQIGYALLFRIASGQLFGLHTKIELRLLELPQSLPALDGIVMELADCAFPLLHNIVVTADVDVAMDGVNWAILVGAMPRKDGMERSDLLKINGGIFGPTGKAINDHAADDVRILVVGNPCNTNCLIAMNHAPDIPQERFFAMTLLDELRARTQLAKRAHVSVEQITRMAIWGNHSTTQFPDFYHAQINRRPATEVINDLSWFQDQFVPMIQHRGAAVIKARGASSAASAANAALGSVYRLTHDTPQDDWFSVARCSQGEYGVDKGLIFSFPCQTVNGQLKVVEGLAHHDEFARQKFNITLHELRTERDTVKSLGLV